VDRLGFEPRTSRDLDLIHQNFENARRALLPLNYRPVKYSTRAFFRLLKEVSAPQSERKRRRRAILFIISNFSDRPS
jgi:hypothetical protein